MKRNAMHYFTLLICVCLFCAAVYIDLQPLAKESPSAENGVLNLSEWNFYTDGNVDLKGTWLLYPNVYAADKVFRGTQLGEPVKLSIPYTLGRYRQEKPPFSEKFYGTLVLEVKLPKTSAVYGLRTNLMLTAYELYVNGRGEAAIGKLGTRSEDTVQTIKPTVTYFKPETETLMLVYQVADFHLGDMTMMAPRFGLAEQIAGDTQHGIAKDLFLFGALFIIGLYHVGMFVMRPEDKAPLYFGMLCLAFGFRLLLVGERYLTHWFTLDLMVHIRLCYQLIFVGTIGLVGYVFHSFKTMFRPWLLKAAILYTSFYAVLITQINYADAEKIFIGYLVFIGILLLYILVRLIYGLFKKEEGSVLVFLGVLCLALAFVNDVIFQYTVANRPSMVPIGIFIFILCQSFALAAKFSKAYRLAESLAVENELMLRKITEANVALENRVQERTQALQEAVENLEYISKTDELTKLPNRRFMMSILEQLVKEEQTFFLLLTDVDDFKQVNDRYGHQAGDRVLSQMAHMLQAVVGSSGVVSRWGGEEFLILVKSSEVHAIILLANDLRLAVQHMEINGLEMEETLSITIGACCYDKSLSLSQCIQKADESLYKGKNTGKNKLVLYTQEMQYPSGTAGY